MAQLNLLLPFIFSIRMLVIVQRISLYRHMDVIAISVLSPKFFNQKCVEGEVAFWNKQQGNYRSPELLAQG